MKKIVFILILVLLVVVWFFAAKYNSIVTLDKSVEWAWANVENQYQRRLDLIPELVNTVKWFMDHEKSLLMGITEARSKVWQMQLDLSNPESVAQFESAYGEFNSALSRLLVAVEAYPTLRSSDAFLALQSQLEGTENRIAVERWRYNEVVKVYNTYIAKIPNNFIAKIAGFEDAEFYQMEEGADEMVEVNFN